MKTKGFTLIELLGTIIILAILALITIPNIMNVIESVKKTTLEKSVTNYIRAVEISISTKRLDEHIEDGVYQISADGKQIKSGDKVIDIDHNGATLSNGMLRIEGDKVTMMMGAKIDKYNIKFSKETGLEISEKIELPKSIIAAGFNGKILGLLAEGQTVKTIEFLSYGMLPDGYTEETLKSLPNVSVSEKEGEVVAYNNNENIYVYSENLIGIKYAQGMFINLSDLTQINFNIVDTSETSVMQQMFRGCSSLTNLDLSSFDTSNVANMYEMFRGCKSLTSLNLSSFDTNKVFTMGSMFQGCTSLTSLDLKNFDTSNVETMYGMFNGCSSLTSLDLSGFNNTNKLTRTSIMFSGCTSLTSLDLSGFNTVGITDMSGMFSGCKALTDIDLSSFDTSNVTLMNQMFQECTSLTSLDLTMFDTGNATTMRNMFYKANKLKSIFVGDKWSIGDSTNVLYMFTGSGVSDESQLCKPNSTLEHCIVE